MALRRYRELRPNGRYLKGVSFGQESQLDERDLLEAAHEAATRIDTLLSTTFDVDDVPPIIYSLADLIGSAILWEYISIAGSGKDEGKAAKIVARLMKAAASVIAELREHMLGIKNTDGTWNSLYPSPGVLASSAQGEAKPITVHPGLAWGEMAQPTMTDTEKDGLDGDTRVRRAAADELVASYAGAYE